MVRQGFNNFGIKSVAFKFCDSFLAVGAGGADEDHYRVTVCLSCDGCDGCCHFSLIGYEL